MKKTLLLCATLLLAGCGAETVVEEAPKPVAANEEVVETVEVKEEVEETAAPEKEVVRYSEGEVEEFKFALLTASEQAIEYLSNTRSDIYICGKICDDQPLTDIQLSMDVSRSGLQRSADGLLNLVPQIREVAVSESPGIDAADMNTVADQFEASGNAINTLLAKTDWTSWDEPHELIGGIITDLDEVSWLYKAYSPGMSAEEGADMEAEMNTSSAIVEIMYARDMIYEQFTHNALPAREEPYNGGDGAFGIASAYRIDYMDTNLDAMTQAADLALGYDHEPRLRAEFEQVKTNVGTLRAAIEDYNLAVADYQDGREYDDVFASWQQLNEAMDRIETGLNFKTYEMEMYQDFAN